MRKEKWLVQGKKADFNQIGQKWNVSPVIARIIRNRDILSEEEYGIYLYGDEKNLYSPWLFKDMEKAVELIIEKIKKHKSIRVIGDYDIDGVCSTYILVNGIQKAKVEGVTDIHVSMDIPDRVKDGYGINENLIDRAYKDGVDTIITCDNGIAAIDQIDYAKSLGMTVIVTDHHEIPYDEVDGKRVLKRVGADATVNPKQPECGYPFGLLCGGAVAYKFVQALYTNLGMIPDKPEIVLEEYIEFAAIATIGDVVDLKDENRVLAKLGLQRINATRNLGIRALIEANGLQDKEIAAYHIGFVIGPCLNASGRLETAKIAFELLNATSYEDAVSRAEKLKELNDRRKNMTEEGVEAAVLEAAKYTEDKFQVIYLPEVHESIAGIIAGRIREKLNKPVIILTKSEEGVKGSGRSIETCNMFEELTAVKHLLNKFGGHAMAAGLSLDENKVADLREELNKRTRLTEEDLIPKVWIDVPMPLDYISGALINQLKVLEPFGKGNEKPVFADKNLQVDRFYQIGKNKDSLKLVLTNEKGVHMNALYFRQGEEFMEDILNHFGQEELKKAKMGMPNNIRISVIYYPQINEYNGNVENQIIINNYSF